MNYKQFWEQDCQLVKAYRKAAKIKQEVRNQEMWIQGAYIYEALLDASPAFRLAFKTRPKPAPYRKEPFPLYADRPERKAKRKGKGEDELAKAWLTSFAIQNNKRFEQAQTEAVTQDGGQCGDSGA